MELSGEPIRGLQLINTEPLLGMESTEERGRNRKESGGEDDGKG